MKQSRKILIIVIVVIILLLLSIFGYYKINFIGKDKVQNVVVEHMDVAKSDVYFDSIDFELEKGIYEVDAYYQNQEYEFKIDAKKGTVIYTNYKKATEKLPAESKDNSNTGNSSNTEEVTATITLEEAVQKVLQHANLTDKQVTWKEKKQEIDDGISVYEIDFIYQNQEYEYKVRVDTGEIIFYDYDRY